MCRLFTRGVLAFYLVCASWQTASAQKTPPKTDLPDLSDFRTVETAITTRISKASPSAVVQPGYLGIHVDVESAGKMIVDQVEADSPAARAGLRAGDQLLLIAGRKVKNQEELRDVLQSKSAGDVLKMTVFRDGKPLETSATLIATSRVMKVGQKRAVIGIQVSEADDGVAVKSVTAGLPADVAGIKVGDLLLKLNGAALTGQSSLTDALFARQPGDIVVLALRRDGKDLSFKVKLEVDQGGIGGGKKGKGSWDDRILNAWKKDVYRLAVICIEFPDVKHNPKLSAMNWADSLFSKGTYNTTSVTGQKVFGSLNDYYQEQSFQKLRVEGKVFDYVQVGKKRADYAPGTAAKSPLMPEAIDKLLARDGKDALKNFDGIYFMHAGDRVQTNRGGVFWPHRSSITHQGKRWPYFICPEGGTRMANISVICHEFGHMLGLPDLYARPELPGSEGVGAWCAMSNQIGNGRPQHFSAWSKEQLGWVNPSVINPTVKQKLILSPVEDSPKECFKVLIKADASEYLLLENRRKKGFDAELPGEGLLIWRVVNNKPVLEESHGVEGPSGPRVFLNMVPYPSPANNAFTPYTMPSSRSQLGGGLPVFITNIRRLADGRITFYIGYEYL